MLVNTDDIINSEYVEVEVELKSGEKLSYRLYSKDVKSISFNIKEKEYRTGLYDSEKEKI